MSATEPTTPDLPPTYGPAGTTPPPGPPALPPLPDRPPVRYHHGLRDTGAPWRGIVAIVLFGVAFLLLSLVFGFAGITIEALLGGVDLSDPSTLTAITPVILLATNLSLAAMIPVSMLLQRWLFGVRAGALASVAGRFRWRWLGRVALVVVPCFLLYVGVTFLADPSGGVVLDTQAVLLLVVVILTTPLQAAGEEFGFRGLVQRSSASWFRDGRIALVVSTVIAGGLFSLAHLAGDPWLIAYYFVFGVAATVSARLTGGLEAPIAIHAANNVLLFIPSVVYGQLQEGIDRSAGQGGPIMLLPMAVVLAVALLTGWWARRSGVATEAPRPVTAKEERREQQRLHAERTAAWPAPTAPAPPAGA